MEEVKNESDVQTNVLNKIQGIDLILKSINCEKYKSIFVNNGINEHLLLYLTANDLRFLDIDSNDVTTIMTAVNVLKHTQTRIDSRLSNAEAIRIQSNICGQIGTIVLLLHHIYDCITSSEFEDMLIDNHLSAIDAAFMLRPYLRAELNETERIVKKSLKASKRRTVFIITTAVCSSVVLIGFALWHSNSFNFVPTCTNLMSKIKTSLL